MSNTYNRILRPLRKNPPEFGHAYKNKLNIAAIVKADNEVKRMLKAAHE